MKVLNQELSLIAAEYPHFVTGNKATIKHHLDDLKTVELILRSSLKHKSVPTY